MSRNPDDTESYAKLAYFVSAMAKCDDRRYFHKILDRSGDIDYRVPADSYFQFRNPSAIGSTALHLAFEKNKIAFDFLLENGANFTLKNDKGLTVLHQAIHYIYTHYTDDHWMKKGRFHDQLGNQQVKKILAAHIKTNNFRNPCNPNGISHFHVACMANHAEAVEFFLTNGVAIDHIVSKDSPIFAGYTPLHIAAKCLCPETVHLLLRHGAKTNAKDAKGKTPLHVLIERNMEVMDWMHSNNTDYYCFNRLNSSRDIKETITNMFVGTSDLYYVEEVGLSFLHVASTMKDTDLVECYLKNGFDVNHFVKMDSPMCPGYTALHFSAHFNSETAKLLVSKGASIDAKDAYDVTPLDIFAERFEIKDIYTILSFHSDYKNIKLSDGKTKLLDLIFSMQTADQLEIFLDESKLNIDTFIPLDSTLWPGYTILHLTLVFAETIKYVNEFSNIDQRALYRHIEQTMKYESQEYFRRLNTCLSRGADITIKDSRGWTPLIYAFRLSKLEVVKLLLKFHTNMTNPTDADNLSHLYIACYDRNKSVVEKLLSNGAEVNAQISPTFKWHNNEHSFIHRYRSRAIRGTTPLHASVFNQGCPKISSILLEHGADVNVKDCRGLTPVHELLFNSGDCHKIANVVLLSESLKQSFFDNGLSHLHVASYFRHTGAVKRLIGLGTDINATVPIDIKISRSDANLSQPLEFITKHAGKTPLHLAKCHRSKPFAGLLLRLGADIFARDAAGWSPILNCFKYCDVGKIDKLVLSVLEKNDRLQNRLVEDSGITMLHIACWKVDVEAVRLLLNKGSNVNAQVHPDVPVWPKYTPLHVLMNEATDRRISREKVEAVLQLLLENGADVTLTNSESSTPLHLTEAGKEKYRYSKDLYYTYAASPYVSHLLKSAKALNVNHTNIDGISHFHIACLANDYDAIESFLQSGVDVNQSINLFSEKYPGCTPLHLALNAEPTNLNLSRSATIKLLLRYGVNVHAEDNYWNSPLHYACKCSPPREELIKMLVEAGSDMNAKNMFGETPVEVLLKSDTATIDEFDFFLRHGFSINSFNPINNEGFIAQILTLKYSYKKSSSAKQLFEKIMNDCDPLGTDKMGRTVIHNIISSRKLWIVDYVNLIKTFSSRGCDIDHQDTLGRTALHTAVEFYNYTAVFGLLENGADINIFDNNDKTAFTKSFDYLEQHHIPDKGDLKRLMRRMALHVRKLQICGLYVHESNSRMLENLPRDCEVRTEIIDKFIRDLAEAKSVSIVSPITLSDFLSEIGAVAAYPNMMYIDRQAIDKFFKSISENQLCKEFLIELKSVLSFQYRKALQRQYLLEQATTALNILSRFTLPEICSQAILRFFSNNELELLISSISIIENKDR